MVTVRMRTARKKVVVVVVVMVRCTLRFCTHLVAKLKSSRTSCR